MKRRQLLSAALSAPLAACNRVKEPRMPSPPHHHPMPALFLAHGAPILTDDETWVAELAGWAQQLPRPQAILMLSAHWENRPVTIGATRPVPLLYDFWGFPEKYYTVTYPAPGAPALAARVRELLRAAGQPSADEPSRGLDHGAYVPLLCMYPQADVPVLQVSLPSLDAQQLFKLGQWLAPLRDEGVLIVGSGFLTHNMAYAFRRGTPAWAHEFDAWCADVLTRRDVDAMMDYRSKAPGVAQALPTHEHFAPVIVTMGASVGKEESTRFPVTGFWMDGAFTRRSVQYG